MKNINVKQFSYHNKERDNVYENGIYLEINGEITYVIFDDAIAHEGLSVDNFIPMLKVMDLEVQHIGFINKDEFQNLLKLETRQYFA